MIVEEYCDGIAFYTDDKNYEIAFYSKITNNIRYNERNGYSMKCIGCIEIPYDDNRFILDEVKKYKRSLKCELDKMNGEQYYD